MGNDQRKTNKIRTFEVNKKTNFSFCISAHEIVTVHGLWMNVLPENTEMKLINLKHVELILEIVTLTT